MTVVRDFGVSRIAGFGLVYRTALYGRGEMDIVLKDPPGSIEVGGQASKTIEELNDQVNNDIAYWKEHGVSDPEIDVWMQPKSGANEEQYAQRLEKGLNRQVTSVNTIGQNDLIKCR